MAVYLVAAGMWFLLQEPYRALLGATGRVCMRIVDPNADVQFREMEIASGWTDLEAILTGKGTGNHAGLRFESRVLGYLPTAFFVALLFAVPMARRCRMKCLAIGVILMQAYIGSRLVVPIVAVGTDERLQLFHLGASGLRFVRGIESLLVSHSETGFAVAAMLAAVMVMLFGSRERHRQSVAVGPSSARLRAQAR